MDKLFSSKAAGQNPDQKPWVSLGSLGTCCWGYSSDLIWKWKYRLDEFVLYTQKPGTELRFKGKIMLEGCVLNRSVHHVDGLWYFSSFPILVISPSCVSLPRLWRGRIKAWTTSPATSVDLTVSYCSVKPSSLPCMMMHSSTQGYADLVPNLATKVRQPLSSLVRCVSVASQLAPM